MALASFGQDVIEITFDRFDNEPEYNDGWEDWIINLKNDKYRFVFDFYGSAETFAGVYSTQDGSLDGSFSYGYDLQTTPYATRIDFESCELTITETRPSATITRYLLEANIVDTNDKHYLVTASHDILTATEVVEAEILNAQITPTDYGFMITANDTGVGIKQENMEKVFLNGYSTKGEGRGTGLYQVKRMVENLGGEIAIESQFGTGTTVTVSLGK